MKTTGEERRILTGMHGRHFPDIPFTNVAGELKSMVKHYGCSKGDCQGGNDVWREKKMKETTGV